MVPLRNKNFFTGRIELVDKDELFGNDPTLESTLARTTGSTFRIAAYTAGYTRDLAQLRKAEIGVGANATGYSVPSAVKPYYGAHPVAVNLYLRVRLKLE